MAFPCPLKRNREMKRADLGYTAGIVDGEGCIGIYSPNTKRKHTKYRLTVSVANTQEWLCQWLKFAWGGRVRLAKTGKPNSLPLWEWQISAKQAGEFLKLILPYLKIKSPQADIALKFQSRKRTGIALTDKESAVEEAESILLKSLKKQH